MKHINNKAKKY